MSTSKLDRSGIFQPLNFQSRQTHLAIAPNAIRFRSNGIEFTSAQIVPLWTEMTVDLRSPLDGKRVQCHGIVVECNGSRHTGYLVSMVFLNLSRQALDHLTHLASSQLV